MALLALLAFAAVVHADEFGQPEEVDFAGKVGDAAELQADARAEVPVLRARYEEKDRSRFDAHGGVIEPDLRLEATGFFRIQELDGRFWFVTPEGHRFFLVGCDTSGFREGGYSTPLADDGRARPEFERLKIPPYEELPQIYAGRGRINFLAWNLYRKYGEKVDERQDKVVRWRLSDWGFNSTAKWGWGWKLEGVPYIEDGHIDGTEFMFGGWPFGLRIARGRYVDMYHPKFAAALEATAKRMTDRRRGDRDLIAYSLENENGWNNDVVNAMLAAEDGQAGSFAREAFRAFLAARGREPARDLRGLKATDFDRRDVGDFVRESSLRYHDAAAAAFRRLDPDHLFYGESNSISSGREWIEGQALSKIDFIGMHEYNIESLSWYRCSLPYLKAHAKPFAILEYSFTGVVRGMASYKAATDCQSERARGLAYRHYTEKAARHPLCLGFGFFMMYDQPFTKRQLPGECHHFGLVSQQDRPYAEMIGEVRKSNARLFGIHAGRFADTFRLGNFEGILKRDLRAYACLGLFEPDSVPPNVVVETDTEERARLFHGLCSRLKVNQDLGLAEGVNGFGTIDLRRHPARKVVFKFFCRRGSDAADWPVFEARGRDGATHRLAAARRTVWEGGFDEIDYTVTVPAGAVSLTVGIDVRNPSRAWSALLADVNFGG